MKGSARRQLDPDLKSVEARNLQERLRRKIVGQDEALQTDCGLASGVSGGLNSSTRPVGNLLLGGQPSREKRGWWRRLRRFYLAIRARLSRWIVRSSSIRTR